MLHKFLLAWLALSFWAGAALAQSAPAPAEFADIPVALLIDRGSGQVLYSRNPDLRFVPASMAKVMTAYVAFDLIRQGKLKADQRFSVNPKTALEWNGKGTSLYLTAKDSPSTDELLRGIITVSANDASVVLAEGFGGSVPVWTQLMNAHARRLGMADSQFSTPNGWPDGGATYVTAHDLARLAGAMIDRHGPFYHQYFGKKMMLWKGVAYSSHDPTVGIVEGADGIKTGHTDEAGYNFLGSAQRQGRRLIMVVAGAKTEDDRAIASRNLLEWGFSAWQTKPLFAEGQQVAEAQVQGGDARQLGLTAPHAIHASFLLGGHSKVSLKLHYKGPLIAPIAKGAQVAELEVISGNNLSGRVPLYAMQSVRAAGPLDRVWNGLMGLLS